MKFHAIRLMRLANQIPQFASQHLFERQRAFSDDVDFEFALA